MIKIEIGRNDGLVPKLEEDVPSLSSDYGTDDGILKLIIISEIGGGKTLLRLFLKVS